MSQLHWSRREFLGRSLSAAGVGASFAIGGTKSSGRVIGANDTIRIGVAGLNGRGGNHVGEFSKMNKVYGAYFTAAPPTRTTIQQFPQTERKPDANDRWPMLEQISLIAVK